MDLSHRVILVTGANGAIGAEIVQAVVNAGGCAVAHYHRRQDRVDELRRTLGEERVHPVAADLAQDGAVPALWAEALAWRGWVDVLVNNAAILTEAPLDLAVEVWRQRWRQTLQVNLVAAAELVHQAIPHMRERRQGLLITVTSRAAFRGDTPEYMHYAASKAGLVALTRSVARAYGRDNVLAYLIAPGFVDTEMTAGFIRDYGADAITRDIPLGEMVPPKEVANAVVFLASGSLRHATGGTIHINGASYVC